MRLVNEGPILIHLLSNRTGTAENGEWKGIVSSDVSAVAQLTLGAICLIW